MDFEKVSYPLLDDCQSTDLTKLKTNYADLHILQKKKEVASTNYIVELICW
jgi:hypothetical protein